MRKTKAKTLSAEHKAAIGEGQRKAWRRRKLAARRVSRRGKR